MIKTYEGTVNIICAGKDASAVGGLSSGLYDDARGESKGEVINIVQDKDGKGNTNNNEGTSILFVSSFIFTLSA